MQDQKREQNVDQKLQAFDNEDELVEVDLMSERLVKPLSAEQKDVNHDGRSQQNGPLPTHSRHKGWELTLQFRSDCLCISGAGSRYGFGPCPS